MREGHEVSTIFRAPGMRIEFFAPDGMHNGEIGSFGDALGAIFRIEVSYKGAGPGFPRWHRNQKAGMESLNQETRNVALKRMSRLQVDRMNMRFRAG